MYFYRKDALIKSNGKKSETTTFKTPISSVANTMLSEGYELMPVIDSKNTLGVVTRKIVINSLLTNNRFQMENNKDY